MKIFVISLCLTLIFLTSCQTIKSETAQSSPEALNPPTNTQETESITPVTLDETGVQSDDSTSIKNIISLIPESYHNDGQFVMCIKSNIDTCMRENAYSQGLEPKCEEMILEVNKNNCIETQVIQKARKSKNVGLCDTLELNKSSCEFEVALSIGFDTLDTSVCDNLDESFVTGCYNAIITEKAKKNSDPTICEEIKSASTDRININSCLQEIGFIVEENKRIEEDLRLAQEALPDVVLENVEDTLSLEGN